MITESRIMGDNEGRADPSAFLFAKCVYCGNYLLRLRDYQTHFCYDSVNQHTQEVWINEDDEAMIVNVNSDGTISDAPFFRANLHRNSQDWGATSSPPTLRVYNKPKEAFSTSPQPVLPFNSTSSCECPQPGPSGLGRGLKRSASSDQSMEGIKRRKFNTTDVAVATAEALLATDSMDGFLSMLKELLERLHPHIRLTVEMKILSLINTILPKNN